MVTFPSSSVSPSPEPEKEITLEVVDARKPDDELSPKGIAISNWWKADGTLTLDRDLSTTKYARATKRVQTGNQEIDKNEIQENKDLIINNTCVALA